MIRGRVNGDSATSQRQQRRNRAGYTIPQAQLAKLVITTRQHAAVATQKKSRERAGGGNDALGSNRELYAAQTRAAGTAESTATAAAIHTATHTDHNAVFTAKRNGDDTITSRNCHQRRFATIDIVADTELPRLVRAKGEQRRITAQQHTVEGASEHIRDNGIDRHRH